jgi:hypothetical protein
VKTAPARSSPPPWPSEKKEEKTKNKTKKLSHLPLPKSNRHLLNSNSKQTLTPSSAPASPLPTPAQQKIEVSKNILFFKNDSEFGSCGLHLNVSSD